MMFDLLVLFYLCQFYVIWLEKGILYYDCPFGPINIQTCIMFPVYFYILCNNLRCIPKVCNLDWLSSRGRSVDLQYLADIEQTRESTSGVVYTQPVDL